MSDTGSNTAVSRESRLVQAFVELSDTLVDDYDVAEVLHRLTAYCVDLLGATAAGILLSDQRGNLHVLASSSEHVQLLELFQQQANEGPCLDAFRGHEMVLVPDLAGEILRWPRFAPKAVNDGFGAVHAIPLRLRHETIGALNLFSTEPGPLGEVDLLVAQALADTATIGILQERTIQRGEVLTEQLQTALNNRIIIEQAKGVLAHASGIEVQEAFEVLRGYGRSHNSRLSGIAHQLVTGALNPGELLAHHSAGSAGRPH